MNKAIKHKNWRNKQGQRHRTDGPAYIDPNGSVSWWIDGKLHRTDGPAIIYVDGSESWWVDGNLYPFIEWCAFSTCTDEEFVLMKLQYG